MNDEAFVYVIGMTDNPVKIGFAQDLKRRMADLQTGSPQTLILHGFTAAPKAIARLLEQDAHAALDEHRMSGEWFGVPAALALETIERLAGPLIKRAAPAIEVMWQSDLGRLETRGLLHPWARDAVQAYRTAQAPKGTDAAIMQQAGFGGVNLFHLVVMEQKSLLYRYGRTPARLAEAEGVLAKAVNAAAAVYAESRQEALFDQLFAAE